MKKKIVFITGAGMSAESGISTFRDSDGMWENYNVSDVADIEGWYRNPSLVLDFYNNMRRSLESKQPNAGHLAIAALEKDFEVQVITQNVDDLHERAGSTQVLHLHGELTKACDESKTVVESIGYADIHIGDKIGQTQARPFIVWFGEAVPEFENAVRMLSDADVVVVVGTSLQVYPAAGLLNYAPSGVPVYLIDPKPAQTVRPVRCIAKKATEGLKQLVEELKKI